MAEYIDEKDTLNQGRVKLNASIDASERAETKSDDAVSTANTALGNSESTQDQLDQIVIDGDSSVEAAQARVDTDGVSHQTLKERLDTEHSGVSSQLAETSDRIGGNENKINDLSQSKANLTYVDTKVASVADGSPNGAYATLIDLQNAFPNGASGIYVVTADGNWYYWDGSAWTSGGVYQSTEWMGYMTTQNEDWVI